MLCPCWFGKPELMLMDRGWCGTSLLIRVQNGSFEGTDLGGQNAVVSLFFPGPTLFDANGTGRVYLDSSASEAQQSAFQTILQGKSGGGMEVPASLLSKWLPSEHVPIEVTESNGKIEATIGSLGDLVSQRLVNDLGKGMTMQNSAFSVAFQFEGHEGALAPSEGTSWNDPEMPQAWHGKSGVAGRIAWEGS
jgi:hypothetical protein